MPASLLRSKLERMVSKMYRVTSVQEFETPEEVVEAFDPSVKSIVSVTPAGEKIVTIPELQAEIDSKPKAE